MRARGGIAALIVLVVLGASCGGRSTGVSFSGSGGASAGSGTGGNGAAPSAGGGGARAGGASSGGKSGGHTCTLGPQIGPCNATEGRFFYEPHTGICERHPRGYCPDARNDFETEAECLAACVGQAQMDFTVCTSSSECGHIDRYCCHCTPASREALIAVNSMFGLGRCSLDLCTECPPFEDPDRPWFGASCAEGHCRLVDAKHEPITECETDADCTLRRGMSCCESCDPDPANVISVNLAKHFSELVCGGPAACDACEIPEIPPGVVAVCMDGRCAVGREP